MDNILKLLLGVLSVAGLLAMLTPSSTPKPVVVAQAEPAPAKPVVEAADVNPEEPVPDETEDEVIKFGEPMIDGKPIMDEENGTQATNNYSQPTDQTNTGNGDYTTFQNNPPLEAYTNPQYYNQQAAPAIDTGN
jgi:hypothetical protein